MANYAVLLIIKVACLFKMNERGVRVVALGREKSP